MFGSGGLSTELYIGWMATFDHADGDIILDFVSAIMVWGLVCFCIGLFTDLLLDAPLGLNALSYVLITFIVRYFIRERRVMTFANTWIIVSMSVVAHLVFILLAQVISDVQSSITRHWLPLMSSIGLWPVLYYCLKRWRA